MTRFNLTTKIAAFAIASAAVSITPALAQTAPSTTQPSTDATATAEAPAASTTLTGKIAAAGQKAGTFTLQVGEAPSAKEIAVDASAATSDGQPFAIGDEVTVTGTLSADQTALKASTLAKSGAAATSAPADSSASDMSSSPSTEPAPATEPASKPAQ
ncbi:hypothetical protein [Asticcacaulis excentricus]|uniref:DUF5666 domain-containing protein n=1 Tax=Asticcacaulis excentricus (strain ATCC 15261 / DSM 4724 / KCTC 12464 / NCIMB 9791 / VKM B-1370 / CB 48) TaxID=573065 RepID=E8RUD4_ASTEC|nr:hypothetical protein [Asticcacaulis excentricus]ADU15105.1 hypothetical protein Astex_3473 [Asticcacaulis excentricus CB 48]